MSQQASHDGPEAVHDEITWVGAQWLMHGYCGRAEPAKPATPPAAEPAGQASQPAELRPVAAVRRRKPWQQRVVRIGPPRAGETTPDARQRAA